MIYYAIRHIPSGMFLPEVRKQYSSSEPTHNIPPRLFLEKRNASLALTAWLKGIYQAKWEKISYDDGYELIIQEPIPQLNRKREEFEIVKIWFAWVEAIHDRESISRINP